MRASLKRKFTRTSPEKQPEPYSLHSTLDAYEVEELDAHEIAQLISERRRRKSHRVPPKTI
jgi:hypothetical protein